MFNNNHIGHSISGLPRNNISSSGPHIPADALPLQKTNVLVTDKDIFIHPTAKANSGRWIDSTPVRTLKMTYFRSERMLQDYLIYAIEDAMRNSQRKKAWPEENIDEFSGSKADEIKNICKGFFHITWFDVSCVLVEYRSTLSGDVEYRQFCNDENFSIDRIAEYIIAKLPSEMKSEDSMMYSSDLEQPSAKRRRFG